MPENEMAVVAVAAATAVALGGAAIALMYHCCQDQSGRKLQRLKKETKITVKGEDKEEDEGQTIRREELHYERQEQVEIGKSNRPAVRSVEEIKARYGRPARKDASEAAGVAAEARNKLMERGEKLQAVNDKTEELESQAESFASLAEELAKKMRARRWWEL